MKKIETIVTWKDGWLYFTKPKRQEVIDQMINVKEGRKFMMVLTPIYQQRSIGMNRYIHGILFPQIQAGLIQQGWPAHEITLAVVKDYMKKLFLTKEYVNEKTGEIFTSIQPTSAMKKDESWEFIKNCIRWAAENLGITILEPGEQAMLDFDEEDD